MSDRMSERLPADSRSVGEGASLNCVLSGTNWHFKYFDTYKVQEKK